MRWIRPVAAVLSVATLSFACSESDPVGLTSEQPVPRALVESQSKDQKFCGDKLTVRLLANRTEPMGSVEVVNDETTLRVTFRAKDGWSLRETHLSISTDRASIPTNRAGQPIPGRFPWRTSHRTATTDFRYFLSLADLGLEEGQSVVVAAHADVQHPEAGRAGAWGEGERITERGNWAMWFGYTVQECLTCPDLVLAASSAVPLDLVLIQRLPEDFRAPLSAEVSAPEEETTALTFVGRGQEGKVEMVAPIHPGGELEGGAVELVLRGAEKSCQPVPFYIEPLPAAPGTFSDIVDEMQENVRLLAESFGLSPAELLDVDVETLPVHLLSLAIAQSVIDDPDAPNSLRDLASRDGELSETEQRSHQLRDRVLARTGLLEAIRSFNDQLAGDEETAVATDTRPTAADLVSTAASAANELEFACSPAAVGSSASGLDRCMDVASDIESFLSERAELDAKLSLSLTVAGLVPGAGTAAATASFGLWLYRALLDGVASTLPSKFEQPLIFSTTQTVFLEDDPSTGEWRDAAATALSEGWVYHQKLFELLGQLVGVSKIGVKGDYLQWLGAHLPNDVRSGLTELIATEFVNQVFAVLDENSDQVLSWEPEVFGPVDVSEPRWSEQRILGPPVIEFIAHRTYVAADVGMATLVVRTDPNEFGDARSAVGKEPVEVKRIQVVIEPDDVSLDPGDPFDFTVTVANSAFPGMLEVVNPVARARFSPSLDPNTNATEHTLAYDAPPTREDFPEIVEVCHTAESGARSEPPDRARRCATAIVRTEAEVIVTPFSECVEPGGEKQFEAEVIGIDNQEVVWGASAGTVSSSGLFEAPSEAQLVTLTATSVADPELEGAAQVRVGDCSCWFAFAVGGHTFVGEAFDGDAQFEFSSNPVVGFTTQIGMGTGEFDVSTIQGLIPPETTGSFDTESHNVNVFGTFGDFEFNYGNADDGSTPEIEQVITLVLTEYTEDIIEGRASGPVTVWRQAADPFISHASYQARFRITDDPFAPVENGAACTIR